VSEGTLIAAQYFAPRLTAACRRCKVPQRARGSVRAVGGTRTARNAPGEVHAMSTLSAERCVACRRDSPR